MTKSFVLLLILVFCFVHAKPRGDPLTALLSPGQNSGEASSYLPAEVLLSNPTKDLTNQSTCGGLWNEAGTICDLQKLIDYNNRSQSQIDNATKKLEDKMEFLYKDFVTVNADPRLKDLMTPEELQTIKEAAEHQVIEDSRTQAKQCWAYMKQARSAALCFVCAADNRRYFYQDKALISMHECDRMVENCRLHVDHLSRLLLAVNVLYKARLLMVVSDFTLTIKNHNAGKSTELKNWVELKKVKINDDFAHYLPGFKKMISENLDSSKFVCSAFLRVYQEPIILELIKIFEKELKIFNRSLFQLLKDQQKLLFKQQKSRMLDSNGNVSLKADSLDVFSGDVAILKKQSDNKLHVVDEPNEFNIIVTSVKIKPMNLTMQFP